MKLKSLLMCGLAMAALATSVQAQEITVSGNTNGSFFTGVSPTLTFTPSVFTGTTVGGNASFSNLGQFNLTATDMTFNGSFTLRVDFTAPPGTSPDPVNFQASVTGQVTSTAAGGVRINFANNIENPLFFTFTGGSFGFFVNDLNVEPNVTATLSGGVIGAQVARVPEGGSTVALLGMAMVGAAALRRKFGRA